LQLPLPSYEGLFGYFARLTNRVRVWYRLPYLLAVPTLIGHRVNMRRDNLFNTERDPSVLTPGGADTPSDQRTADGSYNDLGCPWMGMKNARFGRNMPIIETHGEPPPYLYTPNPREISRKLLARKTFVEVPHLNVLAAAWLQFMVHDWLSHGPGDAKQTHSIPLPEGDDWPGQEMIVLKTPPDAVCELDQGLPTTYRNIETHWWDGSQIYGSSLERQRLVRTDPETKTLRDDGKLGLDRNGLLPLEKDVVSSEKRPKLENLELAGVNGNWWVGLSVLHTLFAREHNTIVDRLRLDYSAATGEWLFQKARLINAALMAKIHTTEWTPALMNSPEGRLGLRANWWGVLGEHYARAYGRAGRDELLSGVAGSDPDQYGVPYAMTEEFTAVYRMHSLIPDDFSFRRQQDNQEVLKRDLTEVAGNAVREIYGKVAFDDVVYSLATSHPGALVLHNFPNTLRKLNKKAEEGIFVDVAATDILRDRERGVPRYCTFRRHLNMSVPKTFAELTDNVEWQHELQSVYDSVEDVDLLVGMHSEQAPPGFGFSDTAFRVFILMATRRLKSDRFYTTDFNADVYTPMGMAWIADNGLRTVMSRHLPQLQNHYADLRNVFFPWRTGR
jgi:hypothetical protein